MEENKKEYIQMKKDAGEFAKWLIKHEFNFKQLIDGCDEGLAVYFDIETCGEEIVTMIFKDSGYVGIEVKENE